MDNLVRVQILHAARYLLGPRDHPGGGDHPLLVLQEFVQGPVGAELHDDAEAGGLRADALEFDDVRVVEPPEVPDVGLLNVRDLLDGDGLVVELAGEDGALAAAAEKGQVCYQFEGDFPIV